MSELLRLLEESAEALGKLVQHEQYKLLAGALSVLPSHAHTQNQTLQEKLTIMVKTTDDFAVRVKPTGVDADGVTTTPTDLTATIDQPALASVSPDPHNPGEFLITRLATTDPAAGVLSVTATFTTAAGISATLPVEFDPGAETSLSLATELVASKPAAASGS